MAIRSGGCIGWLRQPVTTDLRRQALAAKTSRQLRSTGSRATLARLEVIRVLDEAGAHLDTGEIHQRLATRTPGVNISTVYRTLNRLQDIGLVHVLPAAGEPRYGLTGQQHHHAVCDTCGQVREVPTRALAHLLPALSAASGLHLTDHGDVTLHGTCRHCQALPDCDADTGRGRRSAGTQFRRGCGRTALGHVPTPVYAPAAAAMRPESCLGARAVAGSRPA